MASARGRVTAVLAGLALVAAAVVLLVRRSPAADPIPEAPPRARLLPEPGASVGARPEQGAPRAGLRGETSDAKEAGRASIRVRVDAEDGADLEVLVALSDGDPRGRSVSTARVRTGETTRLEGPRGPCSVLAKPVEDALARRDLRYEEARQDVDLRTAREVRLVLTEGLQRLKVRVEDDAGQRVPGARIFLDYMGLLRTTTATHLLDPREFETAAPGGQPMLDEWTRTTGPDGEADFGRVRQKTIDPARHAVVLGVPSPRGAGDVAGEWEVASSGGLARPDEPWMWSLATLRVHRGTGTFHARLLGKAPPRWFRLQRRAEGGGWRAGGGDSAKVDAVGEEAHRVVVGTRFPAGAYRLVVLTEGWRVLESLFAVEAGADTEVASFADLGGSHAVGTLSGPAVGTVDRLKMSVLEVEDGEALRFSDAAVGLDVDDEGRYACPVLPGVRRVSCAEGDFALHADWLDDWPTVWEHLDLTAPFPRAVELRSARSGRLAVRGVDAAGRTARPALVHAIRSRGGGARASPESWFPGEPDRPDVWIAGSLFPGTWTVRVWAAGAAEDGPATAAVEAVVESGKETEVVVRLP